MGERRIAYRVSVGKPDGNRPPGRLSIAGGIMLTWIFNSIYLASITVT
jgi:hypothetical protein